MGNDCLSKRSDSLVTQSGHRAKFRVAVICGSLRQKSTNKGLLQAIIGSKHTDFEFHWIDISNFPIFDEDMEVRQVPADVKLARKQVYQSDAILFGIPQYNFSIAAPMKNAYDWISREYPNAAQPWNKKSPVEEKIGAMVSVGGGKGGGLAQGHFLQSVSFRKMNILPPTGAAQMRIQRWSGNLFSDDGKLVSEQVRNKINPFLDTFSVFIAKNLIKK